MDPTCISEPFKTSPYVCSKFAFLPPVFRPSIRNYSHSLAPCLKRVSPHCPRTRRTHCSSRKGSAPPAPILGPAGAVVLFLFTGTINRVLYRLALIPMQNYVFFLAQFQNIAYVLGYGGSLLLRYRAGIVTDDMFKIPKRKFLIIGFVEATSQLLTMIAASRLPGPLVPVLMQTYLIWNLFYARVILNQRFYPHQLMAALLLILGVTGAALPAHLVPATAKSTAMSAVSCLAHPLEADVRWVLLMCFTQALPALSPILKEAIFRDGQMQLGRPLDLFIVNTFGSLAQAMFVALLLPLLMVQQGLTMSQLPGYLVTGTRCLLGLDPAVTGPGAPLLPLAYVAVNLLFNVVALWLVRGRGSITVVLSSAVLLPLTVAVFSRPLPLMEPSILGFNFYLGVALIMAGLLLYNSHMIRPRNKSEVAATTTSETSGSIHEP